MISNSSTITTKSVEYDNVVVDSFHSNQRCASLSKPMGSMLVINIQLQSRITDAAGKVVFSS